MIGSAKVGAMCYTTDMSNLEKARWVTDKFIYFMLTVYPLFWGGGYTDITAPKAKLFYGATLLWAVLVVLLVGAALVRREPTELRLRPVHYAMAAFLALAAVSALVSPWWSSTLMGAAGAKDQPRYDGFVTLACYGVIFFGVSLLGKPKREYIWVMTGAAVLCCVLAAVQLCGVNIFGLYPEGTNYYDKFERYNSAFLGTIGNVGLFGQYLCIVAPVALVTGLRSKKRTEKLLLTAAAAFMAVLLVFSQAEAAYVGALGCVLVCVPLLLPTRRQRITAAKIVAVLCVIGLACVYMWPGEGGTVWEFSRVLHGDIRDEFGSRRVEIWRSALALVPERPWLGGGPGTFGCRVDIRWSRFIEATGKTRVAAVSNTHNLYLAYLVNQGILGLGSYLACLGCSFVSWLRRRFDGGLAAALGCGLICCAIQDFFCLTLSVAAPVMWVVWGLFESSEP